MYIYAIVTDDIKPPDSDGNLLSVHASLGKAKLQLKELFKTEVVAFAEGCDFIEGEDYEYAGNGKMFHANFEQWWWIRTLEVT